MKTKHKSNEIVSKNITVSTATADSFKNHYTVVTVKNKENEITWNLETGLLLQKIHSFNTFTRKEHFYLIALENLLRSNNFLELYQELLNDSISEEEFDNELAKNSEKYVIKLEEEYNAEDLEIIADIVQKVKVELKNFSMNDISQLFSIKSNKLTKLSKGY